LLYPGRHIARWINRGLAPAPALETGATGGHPGIASIVGRLRAARFARSRPVRSLILAALLLAFAVTISMVILLSVLRDRAIMASQHELQTTAAVLAEQSNAAFQSLELVQTSVIERIQALGITSSEQYEQRMSDHSTHLLLKDKIVSLPHVDALNLINADGKLFNYSRLWPVGALNIADREFFKALKSDPQRTIVVSEPVRNRTTGTWTIYIARKVVGPGGEFIGLVLGAMRLDYFEEFYKRIVTGRDGAIALFRRDGLLLARYPHVDASIGQLFSNSPLFSGILINAEHGVSRHVGLIDGLERLVAASALPHYPIAVTVTATLDTILANWRAEAHYLAGLGIALLLVIGGTCMVVVHRVQEQGLLLDAALNNMPYGLTMVGADGRLAVVNGRFLDMYQLSPEMVKPGCSLQDVLTERAQAGRFSADAAAYLAEIQATVALCRTATRTIDTPDGRIISMSIHPMPGGAFVAIHDDITERRRAEARIAYMAHHDALTDLPNRVALGERLASALIRAEESGDDLAVLCLDFDRFKEINDVFGHSGGDALLREVSRRLREVTEGAFLARVGGDEFILVSAEGPQPQTAACLAQRLQAVVANDLQIEGRPMRIGMSIGVAVFPADGTDAPVLLANADAALYRAKAEGRGRIRFFETAMDKELRDRRALLHDLQSAVADGQLILHYQPQARITGEIIGFEALVRWNHPVRGLVPPGAFIALAEENGLIAAIGEWVLREACREAASWPQQRQIAVNLSPIQFRDSQLTRLVQQILLETGLQPNRLELEITEGILIDDFPPAVSTLRDLKLLGVRIAMDDFGTGYSSLSYLQSFPFDKIKIDKSFISDVDGNPQSAAIVRSVIGLAKGLGVPVAAEGVETSGQLTFLLLEGCDEVQGYYIGRPFPIANYAERIAAASGRQSAA
jgi:diguanylate cyclase (GGDEF)-like protein